MNKPNELDAAMWTYGTFHQALVESDKENGEWHAVMRAAYRWRKDLLRQQVEEWCAEHNGLARRKARFGRGIGILLKKVTPDHWKILGWRDHDTA